MRDIPCFRGGLRGGRCTEIGGNQTNVSELYFPQLRQLRQVT
jgi:hypothetical protein